jgi:hypothetical protein
MPIEAGNIKTYDAGWLAVPGADGMISACCFSRQSQNKVA